MNTIFIVQIYILKEEVPNICGYFPLISLEEESSIHIEKGDFIICRKFDDDDVDNIDEIMEGKLVTHFADDSRSTMCIAPFVSADGDNVTLLSPQDKESYELPPDDIVGECRFSIPLLGYVIHFLSTIPGFLICVVIPTIVLTELYLYTCVDGSKYGISPLDYETEPEYLAAIEDRKYGWRKYLAPSKLRFANPMDYETAEEFHAAVQESFNREERAKAVNKHNTNDRSIYKFCKVELEEEPRNTYYYFPGSLSLCIGDRVLVPLGRDNKDVYGCVVSVGECFGSALPCAVDSVKYVKGKI